MRGSMALVVVAVAATVVTGCGSAGQAATSDPRTTGAATPDPATAPPATPRTGGSLPTFTGSAKVTLDVAGTVHTLEGGRCDTQELPPDFGGGWVFAINIGTASMDPNGPDYFGVTVSVPGPDPDGTYDEDIIATATVAGAGFNVSDAQLTIRDDGQRGDFTGQARDVGPVRGAFEC